MPSKSFGSVKAFFPDFDRDGLVAHLKAHIPALMDVLPVTRVVLFGSWAAERATAFSDIDLLVVYAGEPHEDAFKLVRRSIPIRGLEPHVYTEAEAAVLRPVLERMTRTGISLFERDNSP